MHAINQAKERIRPYIPQSDLIKSLRISDLVDVNVYLKCENFNKTGSFKIRGAFNKLLGLTPEKKQRGVVTGSSGSHGTAVAYGMQTLGIPGKIFVPTTLSDAKRSNMAFFKAPIEEFGDDPVLAERKAIEYAEKTGATYISPYNDFDVIAGQGTIGAELIDQLPHIDAVLVPVGGGGLISGIAAYIKHYFPKTKIIGCLPANSPVMYESVQAGKVVTFSCKDTLSDGTAGNIVEDAITLPLCQQLVDDYILVSEEEIKAAIVLMIETHRWLIEGAAGVALGALVNNSEQFKNQNVAVILCGGNISINTLKQVLV